MPEEWKLRDQYGGYFDYQDIEGGEKTVAEYVNTMHAASHDYIKSTTKL